MTITAEHAEAMRLGRERQLAEADAALLVRRAAFSAWVKRDGRLWRNYKRAEDGERSTAYEEWKANLNAMPELP